MRARFVLALTLLGATVSLARADDKPVDRAEIDKRVVAVVYEAAVAGTNLFNAGNHEGCYRLYQGTVNALVPMLDHRAKLQSTVKGLAAKAATQKSVEGAFTLREALDAIQNDIAPGKKTLWDRLGGEPAVKAVVNDFVLLAADDPKVNFFRNGKFKLDAAGVEKLKTQLVELVSAVSGGPLKYTGRDMKTSHKGMGITDAEFDALAGHLIAVLKKYKVPQTEIDELVKIVASTRGDIVEKAPTAKKPLWDRLGGEPAVKAVVHDFVVAAASDPKVNFLRDGKFKLDAKGVENLEKLLVELVSAVSGGPLKYTGKSMKDSHKGMAITDAEFDALAGHLVATLKKYKVPQAEMDELVGIVASTRGDIVEKAPTAKKPLWDRLGGEPAVKAVVHDFVVAAASDPKVNFLRDGKFKLDEKGVENLEKLLVELVSAVSGGPLKYTGKSMKDSHKGMGITEAEFGALAGHLVATLKKYKVPQAEIDELVGLVASTKGDIVEKK
jgi:hemoglobin